jgi:hypothetical protein
MQILNPHNFKTFEQWRKVGSKWKLLLEVLCEDKGSFFFQLEMSIEDFPKPKSPEAQSQIMISIQESNEP